MTLRSVATPNWGTWILGTIVAVLMTLTTCAQSTVINHGDRITVLETKQVDRDKLRDQQYQDLRNEMLNLDKKMDQLIQMHLIQPATNKSAKRPN